MILRRLLPGLLVLVAGCSSGERDADEVVTDLEGTVSASTVERLLRDVDLTRTALTIHVGSESPERFGADGQRALEDYLRDAAQRLEGARVEVTQRVVEERAGGLAITLTLRVRQGETERYVPAALEVTRAGRRWVVTRARVMR